jgi:hypothetical protein
VFPAAAAWFLAVAAGLSLLVDRSTLAFNLGLGCGAALTFVFVLVDAPPDRVERWRQGADGERRTARVARKLTKAGWQILNDLDTGRGNIDHVLVGPAGVFVLETKSVSGDASVHRGVLAVRWREDPRDGYKAPHLAAIVKRQSSLVSRHLEACGLGRHAVQPVVVLWGGFEQGSILSAEVAWVRGDMLAEVLEHRPGILTPDQVRHISAVLPALVTRDGRVATQAA